MSYDPARLVELAVEAGLYKEHTDKNSGKKYWSSTKDKGKTTWDLKKDLVKENWDPIAGVVEAGLWKEHTDKNSGKKYWSSTKEKGKTTWDLKKELGLTGGGSTSASNASSAATTPASDSGGAAGTDPQRLVEIAVECGLWKEHTDKNSGKKYWSSTKDKGKTTWDLKKDLVKENFDPIVAVIDAGLWKEHTDKNSGKKYWSSTKEKGKTTWDLKKELGVGGGGGRSGASATVTPRADDNEDPGPKKDDKPKEDEQQQQQVKPPAKKEEEWKAPPPPSFPPPPPKSRHPSMLQAGFDLHSRRSSGASSSAESSKAGGWRNFTKSQWLEELDRRIGAPGTIGGGSPSAAAASSDASTSPLKGASDSLLNKLATGNSTVSAQETLQQLAKKTTDSKHLSQHFVDFRDGASQTVFGPPTADACVATVNSASNIGELVPIPDAGILACSTLESLRKEQERALTLLQHVQGTLASQMQEAGVAFQGHGSTRQLKLNIAKKPATGAKKEEAEQFDMIKELGPAYRSLLAPPSGPYWRFVTEHESNSLYDDVATRRAKVVQQLSEKTDQRHDVFDRIHGDLRDQYILREKMWAEHKRVNAESFVDVADFVLRTESDMKAQRAKDEATVAAELAKKSASFLDDDE